MLESTTTTSPATTTTVDDGFPVTVSAANGEVQIESRPEAVVSLSPSATEPLLVTFLVWVMLMAGGSGNNRGAILGAVTIWFIWSATEIFSNRLPPDWITRSSYIRMLLVGLLLQFVLQRFRSGLLPEKSPKIHYDD